MNKQREFDFKSFVASIKVYRSYLGIGLRHAAGQIGTSPATLCRIEKGSGADINTILTICDWMGHPIENFIKNKKKQIKMTNEELQVIIDKAARWDKLGSEIAKFYVDENGDELPDDEGGDLGNIGEAAAMAFGFL